MRGWLAAAGLTALALALRIPGFDDSLFGDELFTHALATRGGLGDVVDGVREAESTPPLYFILAWLCAKVGDATVTIRLPSLLLGVAAVPATYWLGSRTVGTRPALAGTAIVATSATAIFYSTEARAYAAAACLVTVALVALLAACAGGGRRWWVLVWAASAGALYCHYTAWLPLVAAFGWVLWARRERARSLLLTAAAVGIAYVPWLPFAGTDPLLGTGGHFTAESFVRFSFRSLPGHPYMTLPELPGRPLLVLLGLSVAVALAVVGARVRRAAVRPVPSPELVLLMAATVATPAGLAAYSLFGTDIYQPRSLLLSLAPLALLLGALLTAPRGALGAATTAAGLLAIAAGGFMAAFDVDARRPPYGEVAELVDSQLRAGDGVAEVPLFLRGPPQRIFRVQLDDPRRVFQALPVRRADGSYGVVLEPAAWAPVRRGGTLYVVVPQTPAGFVPPTPPRGLRVRVVETRRLRGLIDVELVRYASAG